MAAVGPARMALGEDWARVALTWVDERCVPFDSPDSNRGSAYRVGALAEGDRPATELALYRDDEQPADSIRRVERELETHFDSALDVLLLGMGADGHIASLFPGRQSSVGCMVAHIPDSPKPPADRITLTRPVLQTAKSGILIASGQEKRHALESLLDGNEAMPAYGLRGLLIVTDLELGRGEP
jgi:6-phosphogluconolactonase